MMVDKKFARQQGKAARASLSVAERAECSRSVVAICRETLDWPNYRRMQLFLPIASQFEIDTWPLLAWVRATWPAIQVYLPRMRGGVMEQILVSNETRFKTSGYGIPEPVGGARLEVGVGLDLIMTPFLAFDGAGHRVGYGGGHYDRFLATQPRAVRVGLGYERSRLEDLIAVGPHDIRLHLAITEAAVHRFGP